MNTQKVVVIGLDGAPPELLFKRYRDNLPNLKSLMMGGRISNIQSTIPPITVPAWMSMFTGHDPGQLGIYGFRNRKDISYEPLQQVSSLDVKFETVWERLSRAGKRSVIVGVPLTYPPKRLNGIIVSCLLTPSDAKVFTYPLNESDNIKHYAQPNRYCFDVNDFRSISKDQLRYEAFDMTKTRFRVVRQLMKEQVWDLFIVAEVGLDRLLHRFLKDALGEGDDHYKYVLLKYLQLVDKEIGVLLNKLIDRKNTAVLVVSDHGAVPMDGGFCLNDWLITHGYLAMRQNGKKKKGLSLEEINWDKTLAWGAGGYYGRIFLNLKDRESKGIIGQDKKEKVTARLINDLEMDGKEIGLIGLKPQQVYEKSNGIAPDIMVFSRNMKYRLIGTIGNEKLVIKENDMGEDVANHSEEGICIYTPSEGKKYSMTLPKITSIYDIMPTIGQHFGLRLASFGKRTKVKNFYKVRYH